MPKSLIQNYSKGHALEKSATIGVIALASPCDPSRIKLGIEKIESLGYKTKVGLNPSRYYSKDDFLFSSDSAVRRARALESLYKDKEVKAIIVARGAYGSMEILPELDFSIIAKHPKPIVGFSDITACLLAINQKSNLVTVHGPMLSGAFAEKDLESQKSVESLLALLTGKITNPFNDYQLKHVTKIKFEKICGHLIGGSLSVMSSMLGTAWEPDFSQKIVFLEEVGEKPYRIHRCLLQMKQIGKFNSVKAIVLGNFSKCEHTSGPDLNAVLKDIFVDLKIPVFTGLPCGHTALNLPIPFGVNAQIFNNKLEILEATVRI